MDTSRRTVLKALGAMPLLSACSSEPEPEPLPDPPDLPEFEVGGDEEPATFPSGLQTGDALTDAVIVTLFTTATQVSLHVALVHPRGQYLVTEVEGLVPVDGYLRAEVTGLDADTEHVIYARSGDSSRSHLGRFVTALAPGESRTLRFGVTSCIGSSDEPWANLSHLADRPLDAMLYLGDFVYCDGSVTLQDYRDHYRYSLGVPGLFDINHATSAVATWDDHEVDDNWSWEAPSIPERFEYALQAFRESVPQREGSAGQIWRKVSWGAVADIFVLDCRSERIDDRYISVEQMDWLKQGLSDSTATFKLIINSVPIIDFQDWIASIQVEDRWQGHPDEREEILSHIEDNGISGVLWLSGDMHFGSVCHVSRDGEVGDSQWEIMAGPSGSAINPQTLIPHEEPQYDTVIDVNNAVLLVLDPDAGTAQANFIDDSGDVIASKTLQLVS